MGWCGAENETDNKARPHTVIQICPALTVEGGDTRDNDEVPFGSHDAATIAHQAAHRHTVFGTALDSPKLDLAAVAQAYVCMEMVDVEMVSQLSGEDKELLNMLTAQHTRHE